MREIFTHKTGVVDSELILAATDERGQGNANHKYVVDSCDGEPLTAVSFQNGPIKESGVNGITNEVLLAIVADRLEGFQAGEFRCRANAIALTHIEEAIMWLQKRTHDRVRRGVEGFNKK